MKKKTYRRRQLIRDVLVFQIKLLFDALRDLILSPIALVCGFVDLLTGAQKDRSLYWQLMKVGAMTDRWINLFGEHDPVDSELGANVDQWVNDADKRLRARRQSKHTPDKPAS